MRTMWHANLLFLVVLTTVHLSSQEKRYDGYHVVVVVPETQDDVIFLQQIENDYGSEVTFWSSPLAVNRNVSMAMDLTTYVEVVAQIQAAGMQPIMVTENLQRLIDEEKAPSSRAHHVGSINLNQYNSHEAMNLWLDELADSHEECTVIDIGTSYEGRTMKVLKISTGTRHDKKPAVWIDAGIHAREWIAPATALFLIDKLVSSSHSRDDQMMLNMFDWYILPCANPDGYTYSWNEDRFWRKTRRPNPDSSCVGTDPNRNWSHMWMVAGASNNPCSETYAGPEPFSEVETKAMSDFLLAHRGRFSVYLTLHAYGQYWLTPWGYTSDLPDDYEQLAHVANKATNTMKDRSGVTYSVGTSTNLLYAAAGGSDDWAKAIARIKYSYTVELMDGGYYAFVLPQSYIEQQGEDMWAAVRVMAQEVNHQQRRRALRSLGAK